MPIDASAFNDVTHEILGAAIEVHRTLALACSNRSISSAVYQAQTLTYMRLTECPAGLLINFNVPKLMDGVKRLINPRAG